MWWENVAILAGDDATVGRVGTGFGMHSSNMAAVSRRFIEAFGDDYDQIAVFLACHRSHVGCNRWLTSSRSRATPRASGSGCGIRRQRSDPPAACRPC
jgi:hypothetical protein